MRLASMLRFLVFAALLCGLASCITTTPGQPSDGGTATAAFVGADVCAGCHRSSHAAWTATAHSQALPTLERIGQAENAYCLPCHTVGWGVAGGYTSRADTPQLANVQCENCHGAGGNHVRNPQQVAMAVPLEADVCGRCHQGFHHPYLEEWRQSKHSYALEGLKGSSHASDECLSCHSAEKALAGGIDVVLALQNETVVARNGITCVVCHAPHGSPNDAELRSPKDQLCGGCHTSPSTYENLLASLAQTPPSAPNPRHGKREVMLGIGGADEAGNELRGPNSAHTTATAALCVDCHVYRVPNEDPTVDNPVGTGHTFEPEIPAACAECHADAETTLPAAMEEIQDATRARLAATRAYFTASAPEYIDPSTLDAADQVRYQIAKYDTNLAVADGSAGIHNNAYVNRLLDIADGIFTSLAP